MAAVEWSGVTQLARQIEDSRFGMAIAESRYAFPIIEGVHLIGLVVSVGLIFLTDLRLMGIILRRVPIADVLRFLRPYVLWGFAAVFISGALLFWSAAARVLASPAFSAKMLLVGLGGVNALYFELVTARTRAVRENFARQPRSVRYAGLASLSIWTLVIIFGRLIPYLPSWS